MSTDAALLAQCEELLAPLGPVRSRRMFGGHGLYVDGLFIALIAAGEFYLKADAVSRARFEAADCPPFCYEKRVSSGQTAQARMSYYRPPEAAMESPALMLPWARLALEAALRAANAKAPRRTAVKKTGTPNPRSATQRAAKPAGKRGD
jgi:DNA transformation protein